MSFYHNLSEEKKTITIYWVKELVKLSTNDGFAVRLPVHVDKFVFYSPFIWHILQLTQMYSLDVYKRLSLVYMCILSESPDIFIKVTNNLLKDKTFWDQECDNIATKILCDEGNCFGEDGSQSLIYEYTFDCNENSIKEGIVSNSEMDDLNNPNTGPQP